MDFALEEFKALREEILNKSDKCYQILSLGLGGITIILGFVFQYNFYDLLFFLPLLILANSLMYYSENIAIIQAGSYVKKIEKSFYKMCSTIDNSDKGNCDKDKLFGDFENMGWESFLERKTYIPAQLAANIIFAVLYLICIVEAWVNSKNPLKIWLITFLLIIGVVFYIKLFYGLHKQAVRQNLLDAIPL